MSDDKDSADRLAHKIPEIEITPEMIEAAVSAFFDFSDDLSFREIGPGDARLLVERLLKASLSAKKGGKPLGAREAPEPSVNIYSSLNRRWIEPCVSLADRFCSFRP